MTIAKVIEKFDREYRNNVPKMLKTDWLASLDRTVFEDILTTHQGSMGGSLPNFEPDSYSDYTTLLIPDSRTEVYLRFLAMKTDLYHGDITRYNNDSLLFFTAYDDFEKAYNRDHLPLKRVTTFNI